MVRLQDMMDDSLELLDDKLRELGAYISEEIRCRAKEREDQARKKSYGSNSELSRRRIFSLG